MPAFFLAHANTEKPFARDVREAIRVLARRRAVRKNWPAALRVTKEELYFDEASASTCDVLRGFAQAAADAGCCLLFVPQGGETTRPGLVFLSGKRPDLGHVRPEFGHEWSNIVRSRRGLLARFLLSQR